MKDVQQHINHIATRMRPRIDWPCACQSCDTLICITSHMLTYIK